MPSSRGKKPKSSKGSSGVSRRRFESNEKLAQFKNQIRLAITAEGLQVTVIDEQNRAMFDTGGAAVKDYTRDVMRAIGGLLNDVDNAISLAGHTDAVQYAGGERGYSNWELSADRANASRRELVAGRHEREQDPAGRRAWARRCRSMPTDPLNPMNRRISLVVLNDKTERQIRGMPEEPDRGDSERSGRGGSARSRRSARRTCRPARSRRPRPSRTPPADAAPGGERLAQPDAGRNPA